MEPALCATAATHADGASCDEGDVSVIEKFDASGSKNVEATCGARRLYDCACFAGFVLAAAALLLLSVQACTWSGTLLVFCVPLMCLNGAVLVELVAACVSRDAAEELALALGVTAYKACLSLASIARTAAFGASSPRCADGGCDGGGGCRACSPDFRWVGVYLPALLTVYYDDFRPLAAALLVMWAARNVADAAAEAATADSSLQIENDNEQWPLPVDAPVAARRPAVAVALGDAAVGAAALAAYALCGGRQTLPIALLTAPMLVGLSASPRCSDASAADRSATDASQLLRRRPAPSAAATAAYVVELLACAALAREAVAAGGGVSLALQALNFAVTLRRLHCTGLLYLIDLGGRELPGLRKLTAAERAAYEDVCAVCLSALDGSARMTECGHSFHLPCIRRCLEERPTCPMCQRNVLK